MFFAKEIKYVRFIVNKNKHLKQQQSFLGGINYYSNFIPNIVETARPLYSLIGKVNEWK